MFRPVATLEVVYDGGATMTTTSHPITDRYGRIMFRCAACDEPLITDDFFVLGLRFPDDGETQDDYFAAQLLDSVAHLDCSRARIAG